MVRTVRILVTALLSVAAVAKASSFAAVAAYASAAAGGSVGLGRLLAVALISVEGAAAGLVWSARWRHTGAAMVAVLGMGFLAFHAAPGAGGSGGCPCFGAVLRLDPLSGSLLGLTLAFAGAALAADGGLAGAAASRRETRPMPRYLLPALMTLGVVGAAGAGWRSARSPALSRPSQATVVQPDMAQPGRPIPDLTVSRGGQLVPLQRLVGRGRCVVSFLTMGCSACEVAVRSLSVQWQEAPPVRWVALVPSVEDARRLEQRVSGLANVDVGVEAHAWAAGHGLPTPSHLLFAQGQVADLALSAEEVVAWVAGRPAVQQEVR